MQKKGFVYIMTCPDKSVLYTGVTSELADRVWKHKNKSYPDSFSAKYNCVILVYFLECGGIVKAITEEKRIKAGNRTQKIALINSVNPEWLDLADNLF